MPSKAEVIATSVIRQLRQQPSPLKGGDGLACRVADALRITIHALGKEGKLPLGIAVFSQRHCNGCSVQWLPLCRHCTAMILFTAPHLGMWEQVIYHPSPLKWMIYTGIGAESKNE